MKWKELSISSDSKTGLRGGVGMERISVIVSDDGMTGYIELAKCKDEDQELPPVTEDQMLEALKSRGIISGIKENSVKMLAGRPIYGIKIEVAKGDFPIDGEDGYVNYLVKRDKEYKPEFNVEERVDYKNLKYFQLVDEGQVLCEIVKETEGTDGINIFGGAVPARAGMPPTSPMGKNTVFNEEGTKLVASKSGVVRFIKSIIDVNEVLHLHSHVDSKTGNIDFPGDVVVGGDVRFGYSIKSGGNVTVKGVVEGAYVEARGDINVGKGINGSGGEEMIAGGNLRSGYIESANLKVEGDIMSDYIIDSDIICKGNINLVGKKELIIGGFVRLYGELNARYIGNERERSTRIEVMGVVVSDEKAISELIGRIKEDNSRAVRLMETLKQHSYTDEEEDDKLHEHLMLLDRHLKLLKERIKTANLELQRLREQGRTEYPGFITCRRKLYRGVKIFFGNEPFNFELDDIERCRIFWSEGEIIQGTL